MGGLDINIIRERSRAKPLDESEREGTINLNQELLFGFTFDNRGHSYEPPFWVHIRGKNPKCLNNDIMSFIRKKDGSAIFSKGHFSVGEGHIFDNLKIGQSSYKVPLILSLTSEEKSLMVANVIKISKIANAETTGLIKQRVESFRGIYCGKFLSASSARKAFFELTNQYYPSLIRPLVKLSLNPGSQTLPCLYFGKDTALEKIVEYISDPICAMRWSPRENGDGFKMRFISLLHIKNDKHPEGILEFKRLENMSDFELTLSIAEDQIKGAFLSGGKYPQLAEAYSVISTYHSNLFKSANSLYSLANPLWQLYSIFKG